MFQVDIIPYKETRPPSFYKHLWHLCCDNNVFFFFILTLKKSCFTFVYVFTLHVCHYLTLCVCVCVCVCTCAKSLQSRPALCHPVDYSPPGSSAHGTLQARILEWVAIAFSRASSRPRDWTHVSYVSCLGRRVLFHQCHLGSPLDLDVT